MNRLVGSETSNKGGDERSARLGRLGAAQPRRCAGGLAGPAVTQLTEHVAIHGLPTMGTRRVQPKQPGWAV